MQPGNTEPSSCQAFGIRGQHHYASSHLQHAPTLGEGRNRVQQMLDDMTHGDDVERAFRKLRFLQGAQGNVPPQDPTSLDSGRVRLYSDCIPAEISHARDELSVAAS